MLLNTSELMPPTKGVFPAHANNHAGLRSPALTLPVSLVTSTTPVASWVTWVVGNSVLMEHVNETGREPRTPKRRRPRVLIHPRRDWF